MNSSFNEKDNLIVAKKDDLDSKIIQKLTKKNKVKIAITHQLFTVSILEYVCNFLNPRDHLNAQNKFREICQKLVAFNVISSNLISDQFRPIRFQYQKILYAIFNQNTTLYPQITNNNLVNQNVSDKISRQSSFDKDNFIFSRYLSDFVEEEKLASGGFGSVYRARNILDENYYAIKKIYLRNYSQDLLKKVWSEVRLFSGLNHENIVNYHSSWIEFDIVSKQHDKLEIKELDSNTHSSTEHSHSNMQILFQDKTDSNNDIVSFRNISKSNSNELKAEPYVSEPVSSSTSSYNGFFQKPKISNVTSISGWSSSENASQFESKEKSYSISKKNKSLHKRVSENVVILYIQMKLCDFTLKDWLQKRNEEIFANNKSIDEKVNLDLFRQILSGIDYLHKRSIIHRDIKPGNIFMLQENLQVKIGDFGLACLESKNENDRFKYATPSDSSPSDQHTKGVGTLVYASPEQLKGEVYDSKSDMYSLGIILFEFYHPFKTKMEKFIELDNIKKFIFSDSMLTNWKKQCDIIKSLMNENPSKRPNAFSLLISELFLSKDQIISNLYKILEKKDKELKEKDEIIAKKDEMIQNLLRSI